MENEDNYTLICNMAGFDGNYTYHKIFRKSYAEYLEDFAIPILEGLEFSKVVFVFLDHYTWNEEGNLNLPLPFGMGRYISDFALQLFTGVYPDSDAINNFECFFNLLMQKDRETNQHVPIVLFNLLPFEGTSKGVTGRVADMINRTAMRDLILEDVRSDLQKVERITKNKDKFFLFAVKPEDFSWYMPSILGGGKLKVNPINFTNVMNCGGDNGYIDFDKVTNFLKTINQPYEDLHEEINKLLAEIKSSKKVNPNSLFDNNISISNWIELNLSSKIKIYSPKDSGKNVACSIYYLDFEASEFNVTEEIEKIESLFVYKETELAVSYHYQSRTITLWNGYHEASEPLKQVMLIDASFKDFIHDNPFFGEWEYFFVANDLIKNLLSLTFTRKYCFGSILFEEAFVSYLENFCPKWLQLVFDELHLNDPLELYKSLKSGNSSLNGNAYRCFEEILKRMPLYLSSYPAINIKSFSNDIFDAVRKSLALSIFNKKNQKFGQANLQEAVEFNVFFKSIEKELVKLVPADYYAFITKSHGNFKK
jgi:hypothetical protein